MLHGEINGKIDPIGEIVPFKDDSELLDEARSVFEEDYDCSFNDEQLRGFLNGIEHLCKSIL